MLANALRGLAAEFGLTVPKGPHKLEVGTAAPPVSSGAGPLRHLTQPSHLSDQTGRTPCSRSHDVLNPSLHSQKAGSTLALFPSHLTPFQW